MKKALIILLALCLCVPIAACKGRGTDVSEDSSKEVVFSLVPSSSEEAASNESDGEISEESSEESEMSEELKKEPIPEGATVITNLNYSNGDGKMGDSDGPAYCVYSNTGYNKASMDVKISEMKINNIRESDGKFVNAYMFLGCDVYNGSWWSNCFDTGFCYAGKTPSWHLFYNIYEPAESGQAGWYESSVKLDPTHDYRLTLDTSEENLKATVIIYDITAGEEADRVSFYVKGMKADGSNTAYLMDFALDYPQNVKKDTSGNSSEDFVEITLYNTDEDLYMQNILVENVKIYKNGSEYIWDETHTKNRALWPDMSDTQFDYACTKVITVEDSYDYSFRVDLDMNR
ncbi:MAG: hypothetical protein PHW77_05160 [Eubacteriales bacterium]|nr:hypothetical protein [Eubacteriales bacterium]